MEGKSSAAAAAPSYVEFEPFCQWQREEGRDVLVIHLPEFKKEQLRVQINNRGILKISGERPVDSRKKSKFYKEVEVPKYCDANGIQAKFANSCLYVIMPKIPKVSTEQTNKTAADDDQKKKSEATTQAPATAEKPAPAPAPAPAQAQAQAKDAGLISKKEKQPFPNTVESSADTTKPKGSAVPRMKICARTSLNVAVAVAVLAALTSYVLYMYRSVVLED